MNQADLYENYARVIRMCQGTTVKPWECVKLDTELRDGLGTKFNSIPLFNADPTEYIFALAILKNRPVWNGSVLYKLNGDKIIVSNKSFIWTSMSWNPPKPKTIMIELLESDVKYWRSIDLRISSTSIRFDCDNATTRFYDALYKALKDQQ